MKSSDIHIGMNGSMLDEHPTGVGIYSLNVINYLTALYKKDSNREVTVFTPTRTFLNKDISTVLLPGLLKSSQYGKIAAFTRFMWNTFYYPLQARKYSMLISTTTHGSFFLKNQIITIHDLLSLRFNNISLHQRIYFKYMLPYLLSKSKRIIAVSEATKKDITHFLKIPAEKIEVVYNGYDETIYNEQALQEKIILKRYGIENYFLAIGPTYPHKNFEMLIDAYDELDIATKQHFPLLIAGGKKDYLNTLKQYIAGKSVEKYVLFAGYVPAAFMPSLYKEAYALVFPSLYEGFGFPLLEAMASGCPVITSNISSMPEVCENAALYFDPYNKASLVQQLNNIIQNKEMYNLLKQQGVQQANKFSWDRTVQQLRIIIETNLN